MTLIFRFNGEVFDEAFLPAVFVFDKKKVIFRAPADRETARAEIESTDHVPDGDQRHRRFAWSIVECKSLDAGSLAIDAGVAISAAL